MKSTLLLVTSTPASANAQRAWHTALTLRQQGHPVTVFLMQDGVLAGLERMDSLNELPSDIRCHVLGEDLALRGFTPSELRSQVRVADYGKLIDLFDEHTPVIGAL